MELHLRSYHLKKYLFRNQSGITSGGIYVHILREEHSFFTDNKVRIPCEREREREIALKFRNILSDSLILNSIEFESIFSS